MEKKGTIQEIEKIFPDYFDRFQLPKGAREESIKVYRICKSRKCDRSSFLPSYEENNYKLNPMVDENDPGQYSLSTFEKPKDAKRFACVMAGMEEPYPIAIGFTNPKHGLVQRTKERTGKRTSHVDWRLYKDARPYEEFEIIADFEEHFQNYLRERDDKK